MSKVQDGAGGSALGPARKSEETGFLQESSAPFSMALESAGVRGLAGLILISAKIRARAG